MIVEVKILPKSEVLDSQGRVVQRTLKQHGKLLVDCKVGKYIRLEIEAGSAAEALSKAQEITEFVLYNPLTEVYELGVIST